jgi:hypothetical protein
MADGTPEVGDKVAWNWGRSHIEGVVKEKSEDKMTKTSKGKQITRNGEPDNPAYFVEQTKKGNPVVKKASELEVLDSAGDNDKSETHKEAPSTNERVQTRAGKRRHAQQAKEKEADAEDDDEEYVEDEEEEE